MFKDTKRIAWWRGRGYDFLPYMRDETYIVDVYHTPVGQDRLQYRVAVAKSEASTSDEAWRAALRCVDQHWIQFTVPAKLGHLIQKWEESQ